MKPLKLRTKIILFTSLLVIGVVAGSFLVINEVVKTQVRSRLVHDLERSQKTLEQIQRDRLGRDCHLGLERDGPIVSLPFAASHVVIDLGRARRSHRC